MKQKLILLIAFAFFAFSSFSQNKFTELLLKIDKDLELLSEKYPQENISLLTDKQEYYTGENIFLSSFLTINGKASPLSKTVYIELGDYSGKIIEKKMLAVEKGISNALITVAPNLSSGPYVINAYSLWMKNTPKLIAQKQIFVIGQDYVTKPFVLQDNNGSIDKVTFLPEGKGWVNNTQQNFILQLLIFNNDKAFSNYFSRGIKLYSLPNKLFKIATKSANS